MFARFTPEAREAVVLAQEEAVRLRHRWLGTEHLLLALFRQPESRAKVVLSDLGITAESVERRLVNELGEASGDRNLGDDDEEALRTLGIDLREVRRRVDATFGPGAISSRASPSSRRPRPMDRAISGSFLGPTTSSAMISSSRSFSGPMSNI